MHAFQEVAQGVFLRPSLLYQTQTVILRAPSGVWVIDPNYFDVEIDAARRHAEALSPGHETGRLLLTHSDYDHIVGAYRFPDYEVVTSDRWDVVNERTAHDLARAFDEEHYVERAPGCYRPLPRAIRVREGDELAGLVFFHAPGHTEDSLLAYHAASGTLVAGDYLSVLEFPMLSGSILAYAETLAKIGRLCSQYDVRWVISGHGPPAAKGEARRRRRHAARYLARLVHVALRHRDDLLRLGAPALAAQTFAAWRGRPMPASLWSAHLANAGQVLTCLLQEPEALGSASEVLQAELSEP